MTKNQPKADINFEQELWKVANELRGAVAENQYKDFVLPLIFLKHVSEHETFLLGAKKEKDGLALKIELIKNILKDEIKLRLHKNIKKYTSLKEELEKVIDRYHSNALDSYATIAELIERAKALQNDDERIKELGLSEEELAFYDILAAKQDIIKEEGPIQNIVHAVVKAVKSNLQLDWTKKENAKAAIRLAVKKELRGKVSLIILNDILQEIMQQAEGQFSDWST